jgi:single-strand DNA-binding protein
MSYNETPVTVVGNLTADPELMFTPSGAALARFTVASTPRRFDKTTGQHVDGETLFMRCTAWRELAEHVAESLNRGHRVVVTGRLKQSNWETPEGDKRSSIDLDVDEIGPSLRWATVKVTKTTRSGSGATDANDPWANPPASDPWAAPAAPAGAGVGGGGEPPF